MRVSKWVLAAALAASLGGAAEAAEGYKVDAAHSTVLYRVRHMNVGQAWGRFNDISGTFRLDPEGPAGGSLAFQVKAESVDTANPARDKHLRNADFLNATQFPTITFQSKKVAKNSDGSYRVDGDLTLHGVTRPITVTLEDVATGTDPRGGQRAGFETTFTIKRSDFGMTKMLEMIGDEVRLVVAIEGVRS